MLPNRCFWRAVKITIMENKLSEQKIREIASIAWKCAANAHRLYPENKHTFAEHWQHGKSMYEDYIEKEKEQNPFACFGDKKPHRMDFDDEEEFTIRLTSYNEWEKKNRTTAV